jgi:hypothetical protein
MKMITKYSQQDATFLEFISTDAVHVSGGSSAIEASSSIG